MKKRHLIKFGIFMVQTFSNMDIEETHFNVIKAICDKPPANIILNGKKLPGISLKIGNKLEMSSFTTLI